MEFADKTLTCINCTKEFIFSQRDQRYYIEMGFKNEPRRCRECRALLKRERQFITDRNGNTREYFKSLCAACGGPAYVPFKPTGSKPIYCRDCLVAKKIQDSASGHVSEVPPTNGPNPAAQSV